jgi:TolB-like protein
MKKIILIIAIFYSVYSFSQTNKVAILDFENTSGKSEYDALGKSLSNMLITDLKNNIHPKKVEFYERAQLNKLLEEQKLQKSKNFDAKTAVDFGKLSGVNYVFVGAVFVLEGNCNITSKLVDVKTSKILVTKEVNGKIESWLSLKSELAETIAKELNSPINLENEYKIVSTSLSTLNQYGKILSTMDTGDSEKAEQLRSVFEETNPDFKYFKDIKEDIEELKKQVKKNTEDINILNKSGGRIVNATNPREIVLNISNPLTTYNEASVMILNLLKFDIDVVKEAMFDRFESLWLPSVLPSSGSNNKIKNIDFLSKCLENKSLNSKTCSYYVFKEFRWFVSNNKDDENVELKQKITMLGTKLLAYNKKNNISTYDYKYFEMSVWISNNTPKIFHPLESDAYTRDLESKDFDINWILSFLK